MHRPTLKFLASDARKAIAAAAAPGQSSMVLIGALALVFPLCLYVAFKTCNCARLSSADNVPMQSRVLVFLSQNLARSRGPRGRKSAASSIKVQPCSCALCDPTEFPLCMMRHDKGA